MPHSTYVDEMDIPHNFKSFDSLGYFAKILMDEMDALTNSQVVLFHPNHLCKQTRLSRDHSR